MITARNGWMVWPLEATLTPAAMAAVETAVRHHLQVNGECGPELYTLANEIRACLQHIQDESRVTVDPLLE